MLIQRQGDVKVVLQTLGIVAAVQGQHQAVSQSDQDVSRCPGNRLVADEPWYNGRQEGRGFETLCLLLRVLRSAKGKCVRTDMTVQWVIAWQTPY